MGNIVLCKITHTYRIARLRGLRQTKWKSFYCAFDFVQKKFVYKRKFFRVVTWESLQLRGYVLYELSVVTQERRKQNYIYLHVVFLINLNWVRNWVTDTSGRSETVFLLFSYKYSIFPCSFFGFLMTII